MEEKIIIENFDAFHDDVLEKLLNENGFTEEKIKEYTVKPYGEYGDNYIKFKTEKELRKNKYFKLFYINMCDKYKNLIDNLIKSFEYRAIEKNRGYRGDEKLFNIKFLNNFYAYSELNFNLLDYLYNKITIQKHYDYNFSELYTAEFMTNPEILQYLKAMVYDNENVTNMSSNIILGAIKSNNQEAIKAIFDLFKAAKLSEGLRSSIVNYIDYGSIETYKLFLEYIEKEKLTRFASVKSAISLYTGLYIEDKKTQEKCSEYVFDCILGNKTNEYLEDENPLKVYVALYSLAIINKDNAYNYILDNYKKSKSYRRGCFIYFLRKSNFLISSEIITYCLKNEDDVSRIAQIIGEMPNITYKDDNAKKEYVLVFLESIKNIKSSTSYSIFCDDDKHRARIDKEYNDILQYVYELSEDELYIKAYKYFGKYDIYAKIISPNSKRYEHYTYLNEIYHPVQKTALINGMASSSTYVRHDSYKILNYLNLEFTEEEYFLLAKQLKSKRSDLRNNICSFFKKAEPITILKVSKYLIEQKKNELKNGGLSILVDNIEKIQFLEEFKEVQNIVKDMEVAHEVLALKSIILDENKIEEKAEEVEVIELDIPTLSWDMNLVEKVTKYDLTIIKDLMNKWYDMFIAHKDEEIETYTYDGSKEVEVVGKSVHFVDELRFLNHFYNDEEGSGDKKEIKKYEKYYFYEEYIDEIKNISDEDFGLLVYMKDVFFDYIRVKIDKDSTYKPDKYKKIYDKYEYYIKNGILPKMDEFYNCIFSNETEKLGKIKLKNFKNVIDSLCYYAKEELDKNFFSNEDENYNKIMLNHMAYTVEFYKNNVENLPKCFNDSINENLKEIFFVSDHVISRMVYFDDEYALNILKNILNFYDKEYSPVESCVYFYFLEKGLLSREYLVSKLLNPNFKNNNYYCSVVIEEISRFLYLVKNKRYNSYKVYMPYYDLIKDVQIEVVNKMLEVELLRSDSETKYTKVLNNIKIFYGVDILVKALDKMKKIDFVRAYSYGSMGIKDIFSSIIASTVPEEDLQEETFAKTMKAYKISDKKVLDASLYNKHFTKLGASYLNVKGLEKAMYYFKAHGLDSVNEYSISDDTKKMINRYSDFELQDFVDGKMDIKWFKEIQEEINPEDYKKVYDSSKFIMGTAKRKRGQYFSDAVLGNLDIKYVEEKINDKRNQDMLLCFGLIPLGSGKEKEVEAIRRYKRIQQFLKESKKFGAQRRATETRRSNIALSNLATNYGLDVNRFTWVMEANLIEEVKEVFEPKVVGEIELYLSLKNVQNPEIIVYKGDKKLKSIPAKYKKEEHVIKIKEVKKDIKEQFKRTRVTLENAMNNSDNFSLEELEIINKHPVVKEVVKNLLFVSAGFIGFLKGKELVDLKGEAKKLTKKSNIRIAHCVDLFENNWSEWQKYIMEKGIVQPFKQVFRELYTLTDEEIENDGYTNRFAGYQIEAKKAIGILSSRNWLINDYDGFEKVNHAQNLRIDLYCYADWRNANELEEETLEKVTFIDNKTNKTMDMKKLDKVLFSETMRDLDLVVSVAYVGGVDPLLNHTTLEMRKHILEHNLRLFKIDNYRFTDKHILIDGTLGKYSIHLGSGVVNVEGKGMLPMTPVHNQKNGHIFLPFVDEDPKTSEIIAKILMLAEDNKLKDPTILKFLK